MSDYYDTANNKIHAVKGTKEYLHEKGHKHLQNTYNYSLIQECSIFFLLFSLCFDVLYAHRGIFFFIWIGLIIFDEVYAWLYAYKNESRRK